MPSLEAISITDFRGFYNKKDVPLAIPNNTPGSGLTIIVGPNNSGKTTLLEVIKKFCTGNPPQFDIEERHPQKNVELILHNSDGESKTLTTNGSAVGTLVGEDFYPKKDNFFIITSRRYFETYFGTNKMEHAQFRDIALKISKTGNDSSFGQRMLSIAADAGRKAAFDTLIKRLIPHFNSWNIELSRGQNYIKYVTGNHDEHSSELFGDGVTSLFKIAAALTIGDKTEILLIDEPELSLHPQAQKALSKVLREYSSDKQIVLTTHSPLFINWEDIDRGAQIIRLNKPEDKSCTVHKLSTQTKANLLAYIDDWRKPQLLDSVAKEIFFSEKVVFVEGLEDMSLISRFAKREGIELQFEIFGYGAGGASNIKTLLGMAKELGLKAAAIFDLKEQDLIKEANLLFPLPDFMITNIPTDDIRDKKDKAIEGMFDEKGIIKQNFKADLTSILDSLNKFFLV